jgi:hypothetical protein
MFTGWFDPSSSFGCECLWCFIPWKNKELTDIDTRSQIRFSDSLAVTDSGVGAAQDSEVLVKGRIQQPL